jgi:hypothetical protein
MHTLRTLGLVLVVSGCSGTPSSDEDASVAMDSSVQDAPHDNTVNDAPANDSSTDAENDAANDASDAANDSPSDAPDDSPDLDAGDDASDGGITIDAGGKGCLGVLCIKGDSCCNVTTSPNYGKCESNLCLACCM